jgi:hypothetical protein
MGWAFKSDGRDDKSIVNFDVNATGKAATWQTEKMMVNNIKVDLKQHCCEHMNVIQLAQGRA